MVGGIDTSENAKHYAQLLPFLFPDLVAKVTNKHLFPVGSGFTKKPSSVGDSDVKSLGSGREALSKEPQAKTLAKRLNLSFLCPALLSDDVAGGAGVPKSGWISDPAISV